MTTSVTRIVRRGSRALAGIAAIILSTGFVQSPALQAKTGDTLHVRSHDNVFVVTDPSKGTNSYPRWAVFPPQSMEYRKATLWITYACPDSLHCGEWDYIDNVVLRRSGGAGVPGQNIELARMISPYGWRFGSNWEFTWHVDVTDFALLLHDSVEIEFVHTGYESNTDRGWKVTLDFEIVEGRPAMRPLGMDTLWCGNFPYGDTTNPIERLLHPITFNAPDGAAFARLRIHQTGHGMDDSANCAEFCRKYRQVRFDDSLFAERYLWRECGDNPLYPQSGTWIFDRANWCPGAVVHPDRYDLPVAGAGSHTVNIDMEPYVNPNKPSANWQIHSYLFYYEKPWAKNDVSIEEIIAPSQLDEYSRMNPVCGQWEIAIRNNGSERVDSLEIQYGMRGEEVSFDWSGGLEPNAVDTVSFPAPPTGSSPFGIQVRMRHGQTDEYPSDNVAEVSTPGVPGLPSAFVLALRTNNDSMQTSYRVTDGAGKVIRERAPGTLARNTLYYDTFNLHYDCYRLLVEDTAGDGLDFWFNVEGGYGYVRLLDMGGRLIKSFTSDFGSFIDYSFVPGVAPEHVKYASDSTLPIVQPFPPRNQGKFEIDIFFEKPTSATLYLVTEDSSRTVFTRQLDHFKEGFVPVDISTEPDGVYWLKVTADDKTVTRRIRVKRE